MITLYKVRLEPLTLEYTFRKDDEYSAEEEMARPDQGQYRTG